MQPHPENPNNRVNKMNQYRPVSDSHTFHPTQNLNISSNFNAPPVNNSTIHPQQPNIHNSASNNQFLQTVPGYPPNYYNTTTTRTPYSSTNYQQQQQQRQRQVGNYTQTNDASHYNKTSSNPFDNFDYQQWSLPPISNPTGTSPLSNNSVYGTCTNPALPRSNLTMGSSPVISSDKARSIPPTKQFTSKPPPSLSQNSSISKPLAHQQIPIDKASPIIPLTTAVSPTLQFSKVNSSAFKPVSPQTGIGGTTATSSANQKMVKGINVVGSENVEHVVSSIDENQAMKFEDRWNSKQSKDTLVSNATSSSSSDEVWSIDPSKVSPFKMNKFK